MAIDIGARKISIEKTSRFKKIKPDLFCVIIKHLDLSKWFFLNVLSSSSQIRIIRWLAKKYFRVLPQPELLFHAQFVHLG